MTEDATGQERWLPGGIMDNSARTQEWIRKWYPDYVPVEGEAVVPSWFDGSQEAVQLLRDGIRSALTRMEERRAEERSAVSALTGLSEERIEELGGL